MGKIWLETTDGSLIHLPVVGDDINSPDDAERIPTSILISANRRYGEQIEINHPTYGIIIFDLRSPGIIGSCNQCGHCCSHLVEDCPFPPECGWPYNADIDAHACQHLIINNKNRWPQANNTSCAVYATILNTYKGCAYSPKVINPLWVNCGYSF